MALLLVNSFAALGSKAAEPAVYEGFGYEPGAPWETLADGSGFDGAWGPRSLIIGSGASGVPAGAATVEAESLTYSDGWRTLSTSGGSLRLSGENGNAQIARQVALDALPHGGEDPKRGRSTYLSFLARRAGEAADPADAVYNGDYPYGTNLYPRSAGIGLFGWNDGDLLQLFFGNLSNHAEDVWRFTGEDLYGDSRRDAHSSVPFGEGQATRLVVVRIDHGAGGWHGDRFRVWIDPDLAQEEANDTPVQFDWTSRDDPLYVQPAFLALEANDSDALRPYAVLHFDEFRIGDSWESVTPHTGGESWAGRPLLQDNRLATNERFLGWLELSDSPWAYSHTLNTWIYLPESAAGERGAWFYLDRSDAGEAGPEVQPAPSLLLAYEGFDYSAPDEAAPSLVDDQLDGGSGWSGPWLFTNPQETASRALVEPESLQYADADGVALLTTGGHAWIAGIAQADSGSDRGVSTEIRRNLAESPETEPGQRIYFSFLGQRVGEATDLDDPLWQDTAIYPDGYPWGENLYPRGAGLVFHDQPTGTSNSALIGNISDQPENQWSFNSESSHILGTQAFTDPALVVVRLEYTAHQQANMRGELVDRVGTIATVWVNPESLIDEDLADAQREVVFRDLVDPYELTLAGIGLQVGDDSYNRPVAELLVDEIRLGTDWDAVTPVEGGKPPRPAPETGEWGGLDLFDNAFVYAGDQLRWLHVGHAPWLYSYTLQTWIYLPEEELAKAEAWIYAMDSGR